MPMSRFHLETGRKVASVMITCMPVEDVEMAKGQEYNVRRWLEAGAYRPVRALAENANSTDFRDPSCRSRAFSPLQSFSATPAEMPLPPTPSRQEPRPAQTSARSTPSSHTHPSKSASAATTPRPRSLIQPCATPTSTAPPLPRLSCPRSSSTMPMRRRRASRCRRM